MWKILTAAVAVFALVAGCGDDDDQEESAQQFCAAFQQQPGVDAGLGSEATMEEALAFFRTLEDDAPQEIESDVTTLTSGMESIVEAFADVEGEQGADALEAVEEAAGVSFDELEQAANAVESYASENCDEVETTE